MFFVLSKILYYVVMPATWLVGLALWASFTKKEKRRKQIIYFLAAILLIFSNKFIANEAMHAWERKGTPLTELQGNFDVAIVLTGLTNSLAEPKDRVHLTTAADRIMHTVWLYRLGRVKNILVSGGSGSLMPKEAEANRLRELLLICQVPDSCITLDTASRNTRENALFSAEILKQKFPNQRYLLVTSAFHLPRAEGCFTKVGINFTPFATDIRSYPRYYSIDVLFIPSEEALQKWRTLIHEIVGYYTYKIVSYI